MSAYAIRAFESAKYKYYKLTKNLGKLPAGAIFYHDKEDSFYGSIANGCLKLCWTPDGSCYGGLCGGTVVFHADFIKTDLFELVERTPDKLMENLPKGHYELDVDCDGSWKIIKHGGGGMGG